jgi:Xaa-Pro aminopeptidase
VVRERDPARIGLDVSDTFALADGLSASQHRLVLGALGGYAQRVTGAEALAVGWLETRLPEEVAAAHELNALAHRVIAEAFSPAVVEPGRTTPLDVAWWIRQRFADLGTPAWFQPTVAAQRRGRPAALAGAATPDGGVRGDEPIEPGDLLHCDVGLTCLGLHTDTQQNAYVLRPGETAPPDGLVAALAVGNRMQDITAAHFRTGATGNQILRAARADAAAEGIDGDVYSHPIGLHGHAAGPVIGLWDRQDGVPGGGDYPVYPDTMYALELCVRVDVPEWDGQRVRMALEQGIAFDGESVRYLDRRQTELLLVPA